MTTIVQEMVTDLETLLPIVATSVGTINPPLSAALTAIPMAVALIREIMAKTNLSQAHASALVAASAQAIGQIGAVPVPPSAAS